MKFQNPSILYADASSLIKENESSIRELKKLNIPSGIFWLFMVWLTCVAVLLGATYLYRNDLLWFTFAYPFLIFIIAGRQGAFLQLVHEATHQLLSKNKKINDAIGEWLCAAPIGLSMAEYRSEHGRHHNHAGTSLDCENDRSKYQETNISGWPLWNLFIKDIVGITAIERVFNEFSKKNDSANAVRKNIRTLVMQLVIFFAVFDFDLKLYALLWIVPLFTANMVLMRVRGIAEHGLANQLALVPLNGYEGAMLTRTLNSPESKSSYLTKFIERILIGSLSINYHLEHHLVPNVPHYNLKKLYDVLDVSKNLGNKENYRCGYFSSLFVGCER